MERNIKICGHELYIMRTATNKDGATEHAYQVQLDNGATYYGSFTDLPQNENDLNTTLWESNYNEFRQDWNEHVDSEVLPEDLWEALS